MNPFNHFIDSGQDLTDGTADIYVKSIRVADLAPNAFVLTDPLSFLSTGAVSNTAGSLDGMLVSTASIFEVGVTAGECRSDDDTFNIVIAAPLVADLTASGANGLDTGVEAANTWYHVFVIGDSSELSTPATILSLSPTSPTLPVPYDKQRYVGSVRNNSLSNLYSFLGESTGRDRLFMWQEPETTLEVLTNGSATSWATVSLAEFIPVTTQQGMVAVNTTGTSDLNEHFTQLRRTGSLLASNSHRAYAGGGVGSAEFFMMTNGIQQVDYENSAGANDTDIKVTGFMLHL